MLLTARRTRYGAWLERTLPWPERRAALRRWRRTRPFWAGLLLVCGGAELLLVPLSPLTVLVSLGLGGLAALGIGLALIVAGLFLWCAPAAHHYVGIHALILSVLSFAATNLGGFLVGMGLGIAGGAMGFGWTAGQAPPPQPTAGQDPAPEPEQAPSGRRDTEALRGGAGGGKAGRALAVGLPVALLLTVGGPARPARAAAGIPAPAHPPTVTTTMFAPQGFTLAGVEEVPTANGPIKAIVLHMKAASLTDYRLTTRDGGDELGLSADSLSLSGEVTLYLTKFSGCLEGLVCLTFTPDTLPVPPVVPPFVFMTDVSAEQALVTSDLVVADGLRLRAGVRSGADG